MLRVECGPGAGLLQRSQWLHSLYGFGSGPFTSQEAMVTALVGAKARRLADSPHLSGFPPLELIN